MTANTAIDPMDTDPFSDPATGGNLDPFRNLHVIIKPESCIRKPSKFPTSAPDGKVDTITATVIAVDGEDPGMTVQTVIYSGSLTPQLKPKVGKTIIGKLLKKDFGKGEGWTLEAVGPEVREAGKKVLADIKAREEAAAKSEDPFD